jgi:hypothetical protein
MPHPLYYEGEDATVIFGVDALDEKRDLAVKLAKVIGAWAQVEYEMGNLISRLIQAKRPEDIADFASLTTAGKIFERLLSTAEAKVTNPDYLRLFQAIVEMARSAYKERNAVAHGIWGKSNKAPNGLIRSGRRDGIAFWLGLSDAVDKESHMKEGRKKVFVYEDKCFDSIIERMWQLYGHFGRLGFLVNPNQAIRNEMFSMLSTDPDVREALDRLSARQKNNS